MTPEHEHTYELAWSCHHCGRNGRVQTSTSWSVVDRYEAACEAHAIASPLCNKQPYVSPPPIQGQNGGRL